MNDRWISGHHLSDILYRSRYGPQISMKKTFISGIVYQISLHKGISMNNYKTEFSNVPCNSTIWFNSYLGYNWYWTIIQESRWKANKIRMYLGWLDQNIIRKSRESHQVSIKSHNKYIYCYQNQLHEYYTDPVILQQWLVIMI